MQLICRLNKAIIVIGIILSFNSCKKLVNVPDPITSTNAANVYNSDATATAVLTGIYIGISSASLSSGMTSLSLYAGLSADELTLYSGSTNTTYINYYKNSLSTATGLAQDYWTSYYKVIFVANSAIEGLANSSGLTPNVQQQLTGEAEFIRAFCYFYLVNLYGDVPLVIGTDYKANSLLSRTPKAQVWLRIIADLKDAQKNLSANYLDATLLKSTTERVRPTKWAAKALLARTYLYTGDWVDAEVEADSLINNSLYSLSPLTGSVRVFTKNNSEAIWQIQPVTTGWNTQDARLFIIPSTGLSATYPVYLSNNLLSSFESGDNRKSSWVKNITISGTTYYYPYKYQSATLNDPVSEYEVVLRLGEQYLIRAEARAHQGKLIGSNSASSDLNMIRTRAGLLTYSGATDMSSILTEILHERQIEFFTEWGHRWLDLKRTGSVDAVMGTQGGACATKGGNWSTNWQWYPIILSELQANPNLVQNEGYF